MARIIADLRNGFCFRLIKNSRKILFFCKNTIHSEILKEFSQYNIICTKDYYNHHYKKNETQNIILDSNSNFHSYTEDFHNIAIEICKTAELQPMLICIETDEDPSCPFEEIKLDDISIDIKNFRYELNHLATADLQLKNAENSQIMAFGCKFGGHEHYAILVNNPLKEEVPLVRIHSSCYTGDLLASLRCDCRDQLQESIKIMNETSGILLYIMQEGRGIGLTNKILAYNLQQKENLDTVESNFAVGFEDDERSFIPAAKILEYLQKTNINLLTNNPKKAEDLSSIGIKINDIVPTTFSPHQYNEEYLKVKAEKMGHNFKKS